MPQVPTIIEHASAHWSDRAGEVIRAIVAHGTVGTNSLAYLTKNARKVSIPYLIARDGTIYHMVADDKAANHAGAATSKLTVGGVVYRGGEVNRVTTGFELESLQQGTPDDYTEPQLLSMGWLLNDIRRRHGALPLFRHATLDPSRRSDPVGLSVTQMEAWAAKAAVYFAPSAVGFYVALAPMWISETPTPRGPIALQGKAVVEQGEVLDIDEVKNDYAHLRSGVGFLPIGGLRKT
jgi:hypothetical protein